jgi:hypothetical protein
LLHTVKGQLCSWYDEEPFDRVQQFLTIWFGNSPQVSEIPSTLKAAYDVKQARTRLLRAIKPGHMGYEDVAVGEYVQFSREKRG